MSIDLAAPQHQRLVTCQYDGQGFLAECDTFQFTHLWHEYSPEGFMTHWRDTDKTCVDIRYDTAGRVTETRAAEGYYADRFIYHDEEQCTTYLDAEGGESHYWYNDDGLVTRSLDALGRETVTQWDNTRLLSRTDPSGRTTRYGYHADGQLSLVSLPDGQTFHYRWNDAGQLTESINTAGHRWGLEYDEFGSLVSLTDAQGRCRQFSYSEKGELLAQILPDGAIWRWRYNAHHQLQEVITPDNQVTRTESDFFGRLLSVKDPLAQTTQFRHSPLHASPAGSTEEIIHPDGVREQMHQNSEKLPESFTDGEGKTTRYEYCAFDRLAALIRPDGERLEYHYDRLTRLTGITNAAGECYHLAYDKAGQLVSETDFTGRTLHYEYDAAGRHICTRYPDEFLIRWYYDAGDRLLRQQAFLLREGNEQPGLATEYRYDAEHRLACAITPDARVEFEYDADGHITAESINGRRTEHTYDPLNGNPLSWRLDRVSVAFTHGPMGQLTQWQVSHHAPLQLSHDALGREIKRHSPAGFLLGQQHNPAGLLTGQWAGPAAQDTVTLPQDVSRHMEYDRARNVTRLSDRRWGDTVYRYDANDQISLAEGSMQHELFSYDVNLNIRQHGQKNALPDAVMQFTAQAQQSGRVTRRGNDLYRYDACGRLVTKNVLRNGFRPQQWRYRWDEFGQLSALITPQGERWRYAYDAFGRRISKRRLNTTTGIAGYDFYWSGSQLVAETPVYAGGTASTGQSVYWLYEPGALTPGARYQNGELHYVVRDHMGTPRELLTETGNVVRAHKLSIWGKAEYCRIGGPQAANEEAGAPDCPWRFAGQYADEESGLHYNRFRYYDGETGQYISPDPIGLAGGLNPYGYVSNPLKYVDPFGLCKTDITDKASKWQGKGNYPGVDDWQIGQLQKGDIIYGAVPGQSEFYLSGASFEAAGGSRVTLGKITQVKPHDIYGYRPQVQAYEVLQDTRIATSIAKANPHLGDGGATQYFVEDFPSVLRPIGNPIGLE